MALFRRLWRHILTAMSRFGRLVDPIKTHSPRIRRNSYSKLLARTRDRTKTQSLLSSNRNDSWFQQRHAKQLKSSFVGNNNDSKKFPMGIFKIHLLYAVKVRQWNTFAYFLRKLLLIWKNIPERRASPLSNLIKNCQKRNLTFRSKSLILSKSFIFKVLIQMVRLWSSGVIRTSIKGINILYLDLLLTYGNWWIRCE